jgi:hypothetical protein
MTDDLRCILSASHALPSSTAPLLVLYSIKLHYCIFTPAPRAHMTSKGPHELVVRLHDIRSGPSLSYSRHIPHPTRGPVFTQSLRRCESRGLAACCSGGVDAAWWRLEDKDLGCETETLVQTNRRYRGEGRISSQILEASPGSQFSKVHPRHLIIGSGVPRTARIWRMRCKRRRDAGSSA